MQVMKRYGRTIQIGITLAAGILLMGTVLKPQPLPSVGPVWEYASVSSVGFDAANICYANADGRCRNEQVSSSPGNRPGSEAMMLAAAKMGERGWELAAATENNGSRLYFKRLRSVLNRDSGR